MTKETQQNLEGETAWEEVDSPNFFQFKNIGDILEGKLIERAKSSQYGFGLYTLEVKDGDQVRFHGSSQLDDLMLSINIGDICRVEFIDVEKRPKGEMKLFSVKRKRGA